MAETGHVYYVLSREALLRTGVGFAEMAQFTKKKSSHYERLQISKKHVYSI